MIVSKKPLSISLNAKNNISTQKESATEKNQEETTLSTEVKEVSLEQIVNYWKFYLEDANIDIAKKSLLKNHQPKAIEDNFIVVKVDNKYQEKELMELDIVKYLRERAGNRNLRLKIEVNKSSEVERYLTPPEIYKKMVAKNPVLEDFRKRLEMELD